MNNKLFGVIKRQKNNIIVSFVISVGICILGYFINNCPYPFWDSLDIFSNLEYVQNSIIPRNIEENDDVVFINVSHDKDTTSVSYDKLLGTALAKNNAICIYKPARKGNYDGTIDITNRNTLLQFLKDAENANTYKFILIDLAFDRNITTETDDSLFAQIGRMRDIAYGTSSNIESNPKLDSTKAVVCEYSNTIINTNFTRYQYLIDNKESAALRIYRSVEGDNTIKKCGPIYYSDGRLCQNCPSTKISVPFKEFAFEKFYDLGPELMKDYDEEALKGLLWDKIIIIGDFERDLHATYNDEQPGSYIIYCAYNELCEGTHIISYTVLCILFMVYFIITMFILNRKSVWRYIPYIKHSKNKLILFILDLLGYSTLLYVITIVAYLLFNNIFNIFFPSLIFSILSLYSSYNHKSL